MSCDTDHVAKDDSGTWNDHAAMKVCAACDGERALTTTFTDANGKIITVTMPCRACNGTGQR